MKFGKMKTQRRNRLMIVGALLLSVGGFVAAAPVVEAAGTQLV